MPSPPTQDGTPFPHPIYKPEIAPASSSRSILSFWAGTGPSQPPPPPPAAPPKRKRKKAEGGPPQGRITLGSVEGGTWGVGRAPEAAEILVPTKGKGKGRAKGLGEDDELKEMSRKTRKSKGGVSAGEGCVNSLDSSDPINEGLEHDPPSSSQFDSPCPTDLPSKPRAPRGQHKKPPRPRKATLTSDQRVNPSSPDIIQIPSSDPPQPTSPLMSLVGALIGRDAHLKMSRTVSSSSKGAADDPIDVEMEPQRGPKKLVFAADQKPAHSFFSNRVKAENGLVSAASRTDDAGQEDGAAESTVKAVNGKPQTTRAFFAIDGSKAVPGKEKNGWGMGVKEGEEWNAPLPGGLWPSHEPPAGPSHYRSALPRRTATRTSTVNSDDPALWSRYSSRTPSPAKIGDPGPEVPNQSVPPYIAAHPAIRSISTRTTTANRETWTEKYRPLRADHVLGNEVEATYLRDWLQELSVGDTGVEKRKIHRKVSRYKPQLLNGWIIDDAGLFGGPFTQGDVEHEVEYIDYEQPDFPLGSRPLAYPALSTAQLTNAMLTIGPHGSGKSAAVHAAAAELGWDVFEVHPGMGKRTAASLMSWVGDVGKNHLVVNGGKNDKAADKKQVITSFFGRRSKVEVDDEDDIIALLSSQGSRADPIAVEEAPVDEDVPMFDTGDTIQGVRQSLILIEEADILFAEENTFWPAIISLIAESRRPVVITCNDLGPIPLASLPLQAILHFHPAPAYLAVPYLEAVARKQGIRSLTIGTDLYRRCKHASANAPDSPLPPNGNEPLPYFDLRQALSQLQLDRTTPMEDMPVVPSDSPKLEDTAWALETRSFVDACVVPRGPAKMETVEIDRFSPTADDELGKHLLVKPDIHDTCAFLPGYDKSAEIAGELVTISGSPPGEDRDLCTDRIHFVRSLLPLLDPLIPLSAPLLPSSVLFTLYMPVLRAIIEWEDILEAQDADAVARGEGRVNRKTGRPKRATVGGGQGYGRYLAEADEEGLKAARDSRLVW